jgi:hypothetical protein
MILFLYYPKKKASCGTIPMLFQIKRLTELISFPSMVIFLRVTSYILDIKDKIVDFPEPVFKMARVSPFTVKEMFCNAVFVSS